MRSFHYPYFPGFLARRAAVRAEDAQRRRDWRELREEKLREKGEELQRTINEERRKSGDMDA